ncbi:allene oxide cyclase barrel-like domain-containing protein [Actinomadura fibrosa]|uniref:Allene oxide cyclase barrel-like domain-containing protein n=1 Tax=Actinomadura fibrosa TaxID=111802 RepID=A0ABW2XU09_9ACTN|nr:hypothetical protein [Actinomadura fibrosa]
MPESRVDAPAPDRKVRQGTGTCVVLDELVERVVDLTYDNADGSELFIGLSSTYQDEVFDTAGALVGTATGTVEVVHVRPSDGHVFGRVRDRHRFTDGTVRLTGLFDMNEQMAVGKEIPLFATGLDGRYEGMEGVYWLTVAGSGPRLSDNHYTARMLLYRL